MALSPHTVSYATTFKATYIRTSVKISWFLHWQICSRRISYSTQPQHIDSSNQLAMATFIEIQASASRNFFFTFNLCIASLATANSPRLGDPPRSSLETKDSVSWMRMMLAPTRKPFAPVPHMPTTHRQLAFLNDSKTLANESTKAWSMLKHDD